MNEGVARLLRIIEDALLLTRIKVGTTDFSLEPRELAPLVDMAVERVARAADARGIRIAPLVGTTGGVLCDEQLLFDALVALLECAIKLGHPPGPIGLAGAWSGGQWELRVAVPCKPVPPELAARFFDVLSLVEPLSPGGDLGLGPPVAAEILRLLGGGVALEATAEGSCFVVRLRAASPPG